MTKGKLTKVVTFLREMGFSIQAVDVSAQCVRFHTGGNQVAASHDDELDRELIEFRNRHDQD